MEKITREHLEITANVLCNLNKIIIKTTGGLLGPPTKGNLDHEIWSSLTRAQKIGGDFNETWGCLLLLNIAKEAPFTDGNKRTGYLACRMLIMNNKRDIEVDYDKLISFLLKVASGNKSFFDIKTWLRKYYIAVEEYDEDKQMTQFFKDLKKFKYSDNY